VFVCVYCAQFFDEFVLEFWWSCMVFCPCSWKTGKFRRVYCAQFLTSSFLKFCGSMVFCLCSWKTGKFRRVRSRMIDIGPAKSFHSPSLPLPFPSPFLSIYLPSSPFNPSLSLPFPSSPSKLSLPLEPGRLKYS